MLKKVKEYADSKGIELIATGEVIGQRPMSQTDNTIEIIEKKMLEVVENLRFMQIK